MIDSKGRRQCLITVLWGQSSVYWELVAFNHYPVWLPDGVEVQTFPQRAATEVSKMKEFVVSHSPEDQVHRGMDLGGVAEGSGSKRWGNHREHGTSVPHVVAWRFQEHAW